jgi:hypothetical protein
MKNKSLQILQLLLEEKILSETYVKTLLSIALRKAAENLSEELGWKVDAAALENELYKSLPN